MKIACQIAILALQALAFFVCVYQDFNGRKPQEPGGFPGFVSTLIITALLFAAHYAAGSFSLIFE